MNVLDPGHLYELVTLDGESKQLLRFVKREGAGYPGNVGHHDGTNCQEVIRALLDRVGYLDKQIACEENVIIAAALRVALCAFEMRAARRHRREPPNLSGAVENIDTCPSCGHIGCPGEIDVKYCLGPVDVEAERQRRYRSLGIDPDHPNPDGSDLRLMDVVDAGIKEEFDEP